MQKSQKNSARFLYEFSEKYKYAIAALMILEMLLGSIGVGYALALKALINHAAAGEKDLFVRSLTGFILLAAAQLILAAVRRGLDEWTRSGLENRLKGRFFSCILRKEFGQVSRIHSGELMNRMTSDTVVVANGMTGILPGLSGMLIRLIGALALIIVLDPRFGYLILPGSVLVIGFSYFFRKKMKLLHRQVQEKDGFLRMFLQDILGSILVVRSYAVEEESVQKAHEYMSQHRRARMRRNHFSNFCNFGFGSIMNGAYVAGAAFGGYGILTQTMSYGTFMAILQLVGQIQMPFANISGYLPQWYAMLASADRLLEAEALGRDEEIDELPADQLLAFYLKQFESIRLKNAGFSYLPPIRSLTEPKNGKRTLVFKNLTLEIKKGEYVAFTGASGCGKSTAMKLLLSLYRLDKGKRTIRFSGGEKPLDGSWKKLFAYVPQGNHLMSGTIREIVTLSDRSRKNDDGAVWTALRIACAEPFVRQLERGIDTELGERGQGLSEGQMQRIAIARAIFSGHPILFLDEATSALDARTEKWLLNNLRSMTNLTVVIVTHRPASLEVCDRVIDFDDGGIVNNM